MSTLTTLVSWRLVIPVKGGQGAKTRLQAPEGVDHPALALALAVDTLTAATEALGGDRVAVVTSDPAVRRVAANRGCLVVDDVGDGLNPAIRAGLRAVSVAHGGAVGVLLGDLPALRADEVVRALTAASEHRFAFVPDVEGTGTVLLTAAEPAELVPRFAAGSAAAHEAAGYARLDLDLPGLRRDVDDEASLRTALALGVGRHTARLMAPPPPDSSALGLHRIRFEPQTNREARVSRVQGSVHRFDEQSGAGSVLLDDGRELPFDEHVFARSGLRHLRVGQRVSLVAEKERVTRVWVVGIGDGEAVR